MARKFGLAVAEKPDSQDICFVPNGRYGDVVRRLRPGAVDAGDIVHIDGSVLGRHNGVIDYTIGQRRGLGIGGRMGVESVLTISLISCQRSDYKIKYVRFMCFNIF